MQASVVVALGVSSGGVRTLKDSFNGCVTLTQLLCDMWDPLRPGMEPVSPALAGRRFTAELPGKPMNSKVIQSHVHTHTHTHIYSFSL